MPQTRCLPRFAEVLDYLSRFTNYERASDYQADPATLGTERMSEFLLRLGSPQTRFPAFHIAGTKGKGSTSYLAAALLKSCGCRVGLYVSPHVDHLRERIQIGLEPVSEERFCEAFARVRPAVEAMRQSPEGKPPTYFEILTALAFLIFAEAKVGIAVVEVGLGGRLDATNIPDLPVVASAITTVSRDHLQQLGSDRLSIAGEKAGILKAGVPLVMGPQAADVEKFLRERAARGGSRVVAVGAEATAAYREPPPLDAPEAPQRLDLVTWRARHHDVPLPLLGEHQLANAATALALAEIYLETQDSGPLDTASIRRAWRDLVIPGRTEVVARDPWVILDGAHNAASAWVLGETLRKRFSTTQRTLVLSIARDKEVAAILRILLPLAERAILTTNGSPRCLDPEEMRKLAGGQGPELLVQPDPLEAVAQAVKATGPDGLVCITGSLYLVGAVRSFLKAT
jgi:dihydrofolate synthase / folylpolyglutamate synthase